MVTCRILTDVGLQGWRGDKNTVGGLVRSDLIAWFIVYVSEF